MVRPLTVGIFQPEIDWATLPYLSQKLLRAKGAPLNRDTATSQDEISGKEKILP